MLELDTVPEHLVIIGGSYIALEFAQMYRRFGAQVTVVEKGPRLASRETRMSGGHQGHPEAEGLRWCSARPRCLLPSRTTVLALTPRDGADPVAGSLVGGDRPSGQHRRPGTRCRRGADRRARLYRGGRRAAHQRRGYLGDGDCNGKGRSPTRPTTTSRSWRPTCSTTTRAGCRTG